MNNIIDQTKRCVHTSFKKHQTIIKKQWMRQKQNFKTLYDQCFEMAVLGSIKLNKQFAKMLGHDKRPPRIEEENASTVETRPRRHDERNVCAEELCTLLGDIKQIVYASNARAYPADEINDVARAFGRIAGRGDVAEDAALDDCRAMRALNTSVVRLFRFFDRDQHNLMYFALSLIHSFFKTVLMSGRDAIPDYVMFSLYVDVVKSALGRFSVGLYAKWFMSNDFFDLCSVMACLCLTNDADYPTYVQRDAQLKNARKYFSLAQNDRYALDKWAARPIYSCKVTTKNALKAATMKKKREKSNISVPYGRHRPS